MKKARSSNFPRTRVALLELGTRFLLDIDIETNIDVVGSNCSQINKIHESSNERNAIRWWPVSKNKLDSKEADTHGFNDPEAEFSTRFTW